MNSRPYRLLVVADNRKILRRLARFLGVFGFDVDSVADVQQALAMMEAHHPDFLIVDADTADLASCRSLFGDRRDGYTYSFLMVGDSEVDTLTDAIQAGVDDFLAKPLVLGELLARLRSGARVLEYERRISQQSAIDPVTTLLARPAFLERMESELEHAVPESVSCAMIDIDFFDIIVRRFGSPASEEILQAVAGLLKSMSSDCKYLANFGQGRFAALVPVASDAKALAWAESVREAIEAHEFSVYGQSLKITVSVGVTTSKEDGSTTDELVASCEEAVRLARISGRNCVARFGQFEGETREWEDLARQGRLFDNTVARDVMVPSPILVRESQDVRQAAELLQQSGLEAISVVDRKGALVGLLGRDQLPPAHASSSGWRAKAGDLMVRNVPTVLEETSFAELMNFFMSDAESHEFVVVVRRDRPLGIVYRSGLAALSEPLTTSTFAPRQPCSSSSDYLLVTDGCGDAAE
jgi:two-component system cell cycle response regulator